MTELTPAEQRVADALAGHGLPGKVTVLTELATTAQMAADALGIEVGRIVKSLVFVASGEDGEPEPLVCLVSGVNRVDLARLAAVSGELH